MAIGECLMLLRACKRTSSLPVAARPRYQRYVVYFYRNVFSVMPRSKVKLVAKMLKAIHAQEGKAAAMEKSCFVIESLREMTLREATKKLWTVSKKP